MEVKNGELNLEKDLIVMDSVSGELFKSEIPALRYAQKRLNELVINQGYFTYTDVLCILTEDWPEDKKREFFDRVNAHEGWVVNEEYRNCELELCGSLTDDEKLIIRTRYNFESNEDEAD